MATNPSDDTAELLAQFKNLSSVAAMVAQFEELTKTAHQREVQLQDFKAQLEEERRKSEQERHKREEADQERDQERHKREEADQERDQERQKREEADQERDQERQKREKADKERDQERQKREKSDKAWEKAIEELSQQRLRAQHAEQRAANYEELLKTFQFDNMPTPTINPTSFKMPKPDRIKEELRHLAIGENTILSLGQNLPINVQKALMKEYVLREHVSNFESALAWLTFLKTQHIDWNNFEQWLEILCLNGYEHMS